MTTAPAAHWRGQGRVRPRALDLGPRGRTAGRLLTGHLLERRVSLRTLSWGRPSRTGKLAGPVTVFAPRSGIAGIVRAAQRVPVS